MSSPYDAAVSGRNRQAAEKLLLVAKQLGKEEDAVIAQLQVAYSWRWEAEHSKAEEAALTAMKLAKESKVLDANLASLIALGKVMLSADKEERARDYIDKALVLSKAKAARKWEALSLSAMAEVELASGDFECALRYLDKAKGIVSPLGDQPGQEARLALVMADLFIHKGKLVEAQRCAQTASKLASTSSALVALQAETLCKEARCHLLLGETQEAQYKAREALELARDLTEHDRWQVEAMGVWMQAQLAEGKPKQARDTCREILELFEDFNVSVNVRAEWSLTLATILRDLAEYEEMHRYARHVLSTLQPTDKELQRRAAAMAQDAGNLDLAETIWTLAQASFQHGHQREGVQVLPNYDLILQKQYQEVLQ
mmetsp:Transcript_2249/g.4719  ORF Transcript_2249/g.4719 Transcript_2249/m.4719 type:complete len:372 (+) Transcript_2249:52-1167(+)